MATASEHALWDATVKWLTEEHDVEPRIAFLASDVVAFDRSLREVFSSDALEVARAVNLAHRAGLSRSSASAFPGPEEAA